MTEPITLTDKMRELVDTSPKTLRQIAKDAGVPFFWLRGVVYDSRRNQSVNRIQKVYENLSGKKLIQ